MAQVIFHIDINAFFASAHQTENPELKDKPIVVCSNNRSSVVTTASYEARAYGVHSAMPLVQAKQLCPNLSVVDIDFNLYQELSAEFMAIIRSYSPYMQPASIDECYVEVGEIIKNYDKPLDLAVEIQQRVMQELQLPISIGVAPNKFLAKMASDMKKPMGITVLRIREVEEKLWPLPIEDMHGIGKKTVPRLKKINIHTIRDLATSSLDSLKPVLGNSAYTFIQKANGHDQSPIELITTAKSMGQSKTYSTALHSEDDIRDALMIEVVELSRRLKKSGLAGRTLQFSIRLDDYTTAARSQTYQEILEDADEIFEKTMLMLDEFTDGAGVTFLSITVANLVNKDESFEQLNLFNDVENPDVPLIIERLNKELNLKAFKSAGDLLKNES
ncbi:DNA polymerase IV [Erysipelothrix urinaevulpis]|uniref:DNA polymerase IV n=1 Tax=Erysipelothrix urinaevulpis TaxID=2683717 RepID=UPI00135CEA8E|nr:DNA polymerase IV [Erysipelothrix urinaevulpis]